MKLLTMLLFINALLFSQEAVFDSNTSKKSFWGVEFNIIRPFIMRSVCIDSYSGGLNYFDDNNGVEIAVPFTYTNISNDRNIYGINDYDDTSMTLDFHARKFIDNKANGAYIGTFVRYTYLEGKSKNLKIAKLHRFGVGVEIGFRMRSGDSPWYRGISVGTGIYLDDHQDVFEHDNYLMEMDGRKKFWDIELLKIGFAF